MRVVILSDLHLGNGGVYDVFAGADELPRLLADLRSEPTHVVLAGDTFDFLLDDEPLILEETRATEQARSLVGGEVTGAILKALGEVIVAGGRVTITPGNHDLQLVLPCVQSIVRKAMGRPENDPALCFVPGNHPVEVDVQGTRVLINHGEQVDGVNRVDYPQLLAFEQTGHFDFPPGSLLVKGLLNPLISQHGMRYMDLLKPDFQGAVLTGLGANPRAVKVVWGKSTLELIRRLYQQHKVAPAFVPGGDTGASLVGQAFANTLSDEEGKALLRMVSLDQVAFGLLDAGLSLLRSARLKIARAGLRMYAKIHRAATGVTGSSFFELEPGEGELEEARRLADKFRAQVVIAGHTHAARWHEEPGLVFINTGTWISLLRLPALDATDAEWTDFLAELGENPGLEPSRQRLARVESHFTFAVVDAAPGGGACVQLRQFLDNQAQVIEQSVVGPAAPQP